MSARFESGIEGALEPLERRDTEVIRGLFAETEPNIDAIRGQLLLSLDDLKVLTVGLPFEVEQNCLDAWEEGKAAEDIGDWAMVEESKMFIRGRLISHNILQ